MTLSWERTETGYAVKVGGQERARVLPAKPYIRSKLGKRWTLYAVGKIEPLHYRTISEAKDAAHQAAGAGNG